MGTIKREDNKFILDYNCFCCYSLWEIDHFEAELPLRYAIKWKIYKVLKNGEEAMLFNSDAAKRDYQLDVIKLLE
jgi:hypothetical protein